MECSVSEQYPFFDDPSEPRLLARLVLVPSLSPDEVITIEDNPELPIVPLVDAIPELEYVTKDGNYIPFNRRKYRSGNAHGAGGTVDSFSLYMNDVRALGPLLTVDDERVLSQYVQAGLGARSLFADSDALKKFEAREIELTPELLNIEIACTQEEERFLRRVLKDGKDAHDAFVTSNLRLVFKHAKYRLPSVQHLELLDLLQEGNIILGHAVEKFDWKKGFKFSTYADAWIRKYMDRAIEQMEREVRMPGAPKKLLGQVQILRKDHPEGRHMSTSQIAEHLGVSVEKVEDVIPYIASTMQLDQSIGEDDGADLKDLIAAPDDIETASDPMQVLAVKEALASLEDRRRLAVVLINGYNCEKKSFKEVGDMLGVTPQRVHQLYREGTEKLKEKLNRDDFIF